MRRLLAAALAALLLAAPAAAQTPTLSDRQIRQIVGYAVAQKRNAMEADTAELAHLLRILAAIDARVQEDSIADLPSDSVPADTAAPPTYTGIRLLPDSALLAVGDTARWHVDALDSLGVAVPLPEGTVVTWTLSDSAALSIDSAGIGIALAAPAGGAAQLQAATVWGNATARVLIAPRPPPIDTVKPPPASGYSPVSPHWRHMRYGGIDYRIHYQQGAQRSAEYDWLAQHADYQIGGNVAEMQKRNPNFRTMLYDQLWMDYATASKAVSNWLAANGYDPEEAFLHYRAGANVPAHTNDDGAAVPAHVASGLKRKEDRITHLQYGGKSFYYYNVADPGWLAYRAQATQKLAGQGAWSIFFDTNSISAISKYATAQPTLEFGSHSEYMAAHEAALAAQRAHVPAGYVCLNQSTYFNRAPEQALARVAGCTMTEFVNASHRNPQWDAVDALVAAGVVVDYSGQASDHFQDVQFGESPGNYPDVRTRRMIWNYSSYLMVVDPANMDLVIFDDYIDAWTAPHTIAWLDAYAVDIGLATGPRRVLQRTTDPAGQTAIVYARDFERALVLIRKQENQGTNGYDMSDRSAVTVDLPAGTWRMLQPDGTTGAAVTSVQLRMGEAVILIRG